MVVLTKKYAGNLELCILIFLKIYKPTFFFKYVCLILYMWVLMNLWKTFSSLLIQIKFGP